MSIALNIKRLLRSTSQSLIEIIHKGEIKMSKHPNKKSITKNDLIRSLKESHVFISQIAERLVNLEKVFEVYIEMNEDEDKFSDFIQKKVDVAKKDSEDKEKEDAKERND